MSEYEQLGLPFEEPAYVRTWRNRFDRYCDMNALLTAALDDDVDAARVVLDALDCGQVKEIAYDLARWRVDVWRRGAGDTAQLLQLHGLGYAAEAEREEVER